MNIKKKKAYKSPYSIQQQRFTPEYYQYLYQELLNFIGDGEELPNKWMKDILLLLLEKSLEKPAPRRKLLRKKIVIDLKPQLKRVREKWLSEIITLKK